jgi:dihydrofolate reductase
VSDAESGAPGRVAPRHIAIVLLAAVADNGVIGRDNALPFRQSSDLKRFKALTMGKPVLMGRKTYLSIGKPLPGRTNIVVSRDPGFAPSGVMVARDLDSALAMARDDALRRGADEIVVIGGTGLFEQTMPVADRMEITHVHAHPAGDTYFPPIDAARWRVDARSEHPAGPQDEAAFSYVTYARA